MNKDFLFDLLKTHSPSGHEHNCIKVFDDYCSKFGKHIYTDKMGNSAFSIGNENGPIVMISGHIDEISMLVQYIDDDGFIHFVKNGGIDPKILLGMNVVILTKKGEINGVIGKAPIHVEWRDEEKKTKVTPIKDMKVDCGFKSKREAEEYVSVGDVIIYNTPITELHNGRISSKGLDDKVGAFIAAEVARHIAQEEPLKNINLVFAACCEEETGCRGASLVAKNLNPQYSIDYDVTFATDDGHVEKNEWGDIKLGKGAAIAFGDDKVPSFVNTIVDIAKAAEIPFQPFCVGSGGTNTDSIQMGASDCTTSLISIPERNMHTSVEVVDLFDISAIIALTVAVIRHLDETLG